jgi:hypothetical protein
MLPLQALSESVRVAPVAWTVVYAQNVNTLLYMRMPTAATA